MLKWLQHAAQLHAGDEWGQQQQPDEELLLSAAMMMSRMRQVAPYSQAPLRVQEWRVREWMVQMVAVLCDDYHCVKMDEEIELCQREVLRVPVRQREVLRVPLQRDAVQRQDAEWRQHT